MKYNLFIIIFLFLLFTSMNMVICTRRGNHVPQMRYSNASRHYHGVLQKPVEWCTQNTFTGERADTRDTELKTSIIIPCCATHAQHLYPLLKLYEQQTVLPDEVVISLSDVTHVEKDILNTLEDELWSFPITLLLSEQTLFAGANRNIACCHASGDIFICQDADDIPHPQCVEIIKYFFKTYKIDHLMYQYINIPKDTSPPFEHYEDMSAIQCVCNAVFDAIYCLLFTNGNIAIARHVFDKIQWSPTMERGQDTLFNRIAHKKLKYCFAIKAVLLGYRMFLSSQNEQAHYTISPLDIPKRDTIYHTDKNLYSVNIIIL